MGLQAFQQICIHLISCINIRWKKIIQLLFIAKDYTLYFRGFFKKYFPCFCWVKLAMERMVMYTEKLIKPLRSQNAHSNYFGLKHLRFNYIQTSEESNPMQFESWTISPIVIKSTQNYKCTFFSSQKQDNIRNFWNQKYMINMFRH